MTSLEKFLLSQEGMAERRSDGRLVPYRCSEGKLTIGVGRNLEDRGISEQEALYLLRNDIKDATAEARRICPVFNWLNEARQMVLVSMVFQLGPEGVRGFRNMLAAIEEQDFDRAADEMLDSRWAEQTPRRARLQADMMKSGAI